mgnify:CR=1 FL=1
MPGAMGSAEATFLLIPEEGRTRVTWKLVSALPFQPLARWFGLFFPYLIGKDYDEGLARLREIGARGDRIETASWASAAPRRSGRSFHPHRGRLATTC